jgi:hypothetical protein
MVVRGIGDGEVAAVVSPSHVACGVDEDYATFSSYVFETGYGCLCGLRTGTFLQLGHRPRSEGYA